MKSTFKSTVYILLAAAFTIFVVLWFTTRRVPPEMQELLEVLRAQNDSMAGIIRIQNEQIIGQRELISLQDGAMTTRDELIAAQQEQIRVLEDLVEAIQTR